jgi:ParB-like chromosome segregation protein Spo0J
MNVHIKVAGRETTKMVQVAQNGLVDVQDRLEEVRDTIERKEDAGVDTSRDQRLLTKLLREEKDAASILKLMLEAQAVYRSKYGSKRHYKLDKSDAARKTKRDPKRELAEAQEYGWYSWRELHIVPLSEIEPQKVWKPSRIERLREGLADNVALPAVKLARQDGRYKYAITDGIHRYNASLEAGFSHIPAIVTVTEDVPHMKTEKKVFYAGQFVTFKDKLNGRWEYGYLVENLYNDVFVTMVADDTEADWAGDLGSHYFDRVVTPPRHIKDLIMGHWFLNRKSSDRTAKNVPKKVKEYVKKFEDEGKDESFAWSLAWSIYCEHKNPGSPSCKQESYLEGRKTSSIAVRVAARYFKPENPS